MKRMMINEDFLKDAMPPSHFRAFISFLKHEDSPKIGCTKISTSLDSRGARSYKMVNSKVSGRFTSHLDLVVIRIHSIS